jgi:predicted component of type VI protein secretion system
MAIYDIGGSEVKGDASEALSELPQNKTLMVEKLTKDPPIKPVIVEGLKSIDEVFEHFSPSIEMDFHDSEGGTHRENLRFKNLGDFGTKGITNQSEFLNGIAAQKEQNQKMIRHLKTNKMLQKALEDEKYKTALLNAINALIKELEQNKYFV